MKEFNSFYKTVGGNEGNKCHYPTRLDTYGCGCQHLYWQEHFNYNPNDCCNLRNSKVTKQVVKEEKKGRLF